MFFPLLAFENLLGLSEVTKEDLKEAHLLDVHSYVEDGITYQQKVYRLSDHSIYTETQVIKDVTKKELEIELGHAIQDQRFEDAAKIRDTLKNL